MSRQSNRFAYSARNSARAPIGLVFFRTRASLAPTSSHIFSPARRRSSATPLPSRGILLPTWRTSRRFHLPSTSGVVDFAFPNPQIHQWNVGVQRDQFGFVWKASCIGTKGNHLPRSRELNLPAQPLTTATSQQWRRDGMAYPIPGSVRGTERRRNPRKQPDRPFLQRRLCTSIARQIPIITPCS